MATKVCVLCVRGTRVCEVFQKTEVDIKAIRNYYTNLPPAVSHLRI